MQDLKHAKAGAGQIICLALEAPVKACAFHILANSLFGSGEIRVQCVP
jgi:hypothetical protein